MNCAEFYNYRRNVNPTPVTAQWGFLGEESKAPAVGSMCFVLQICPSALCIRRGFTQPVLDLLGSDFTTSIFIVIPHPSFEFSFWLYSLPPLCSEGNARRFWCKVHSAVIFLLWQQTVGQLWWREDYGMGRLAGSFSHWYRGWRSLCDSSYQEGQVLFSYLLDSHMG